MCPTLQKDIAEIKETGNLIRAEIIGDPHNPERPSFRERMRKLEDGVDVLEKDKVDRLKTDIEDLRKNKADRKDWKSHLTVGLISGCTVGLFVWLLPKIFG